MLRISLDQCAYNRTHSELVRELNSSTNGAILNKFPSTSLKELNEMALDNRVDSKFVLPKKILGDILEHLSNNYSILTVDNQNIFTYENTYFDTPDRFFYKSHHNGKLNRQKLRFRRYKESDLCVLETKLKTNKLRTIKQRIPIKENNQEDIVSFLNEHIHSITGSLSPKLFNNYHRMTFTHLRKKEKVTIDFNLGFENPDNSLQYHIDDYFVVEVKTNDKVHLSEFSLYCKENGIRKKRFSKYCMGTCLTNNNEFKKSNFKKELSLFR
ncbi:MAG: hypothetical protein ACJAYF_000306 [Arenicella sp.]|jgi:hypothetical protein